MPPLDPRDHHLVSAAEGWFELGNPHEALSELDALSEAARRHPAVLELRWSILAQQGAWDLAVPVAEDLIRSAPGIAAGWLHRAYALRRASHGGLPQAWSALHPAADLFPSESLIAYNLACYATQMGRVDEGWEWFLRAIQISGDGRALRAMGLRDEDLQPLRDRILSLK